jgi:hypothetical protein
MKTGIEFHEPVRVVMHLNGGFTRVALEDHADAGRYWDLPTDKIPAHLRAIGSRFFVRLMAVQPEPCDSVDAIRLAMRDFVVEEP